jgi:hypothetical protein
MKIDVVFKDQLARYKITMGPKYQWKFNQDHHASQVIMDA